MRVSRQHIKVGQSFNPFQRFDVNALVPMEVLRIEQLSHGAKLLYGLLRLYAGRNGRCFPSRDRLARDMGVKRRTVSAYLRELHEARLIKTEQPSGGTYRLLLFPMARVLRSAASG